MPVRPLLALLAAALALSACVPGETRNCSQFATHEQAQHFFEREGGPERDRHNLDPDRNGVACEELL